MSSRKILVDVTHPAHFHFFRPAMEAWRQKGYQLIVGARKKDVTLELLDAHGYEYTILSSARKGTLGLFRELLEHEYRLWHLIRRTRPNVVLEVAGTFIVHAAALSRTPALVFYDTEHARLSNAITYPFATKVITPAAYQGDIGRKHVRYDGFQELAYLHPNYFKPDPGIRRELGVDENETYFVVRFVSWDASHDVGHRGFTPDGRRALVEMLVKRGRVVISSEAPLPQEFEAFRYRLSPSRMHDVLASATLFVGEGGTMATEAAILGTPSVFVSTLESGNWYELRDRYELLYFYSDEQLAVNKVEHLISAPDIQKCWQMRQQQLLVENVDVTGFVMELVEAYL